MIMTIESSFLLFILQNGGGGSIVGLLLPWILIFGIFYFLVIRPQQRRQRQAALERENLLSAIKPGDKIITNGGIYGRIVRVYDDKVELSISKGVSIEMLKSSIYAMQSEEVKEVKEAEPVK